MPSPGQRTLFVFALKPEWAFVRSAYSLKKIPGSAPLYAFQKNPDCYLVQTGPGVRRTHEILAPLLTILPVNRLIHLGTCGGLTSRLNSGDIFLSHDVASAAAPDAEPIPCHAGLVSAFASMLSRHHIPCLTGRLLTAATVLKNAGEKASAASRGEAVDMESHAAATLCQELGIAYTSVRGVFDTLADKLDDMEDVCDLTGELRPTRIAANILKSPKLILTLPGLKKRMDVIGERLALVLEECLRR